MELLLWFTLGILTGIVTGLAPGIHINVVASILVSAVASVGGTGYEEITVFLMAAATAHVFFDFFPSVFLGIRSDDSMLDLPAHRLVKSGDGVRSLHFSAIGTLTAFLIGTALIWIFSIDGPWNLPAVLEDLLKRESLLPNIRVKALVLVLLCIFVVGSAGSRWQAASVVFLVSGAFGLVMLRYGEVLVSKGIFGSCGAGFNFLFAALTGMFGLGFLIESLFGRSSRIPEQERVREIAIGEFVSAAKASIAGVCGGIVTGILPGLGSANAAALIDAIYTPITRKSNDRTAVDQRSKDQRFIALTGAIQAADMVFAALVGYFVVGGVMRSGIAVAFDTLNVPHDDMKFLIAPAVACIASALICAGLLFIYGHHIVNGFVRLAATLDVRVILGGVTGFIVTLLLLFTGWMGAIVCTIGLAIWTLTNWLQVRFSMMMGFFLLPVTLYAWVPRGNQKLPWLIKGWGANVAASPETMSIGMVFTSIASAIIAGMIFATILRKIIKRS